MQGQGQEKTAIVVASQVQAPVYKYLEPSVGCDTLCTSVRSVLGIEVPWSSWSCVAFSSTCTRCKSVKRLPKKVCWVPSTCLTGRELVGLLVMYLCCHHPFLCSPPWFRDSLARFSYFVADHIEEFVMKPAQRAALRKNVDFFL